MASQLQMTVNGRRHLVDAAPDTPLLYVLRSELNLNGPKFDCDRLVTERLTRRYVCRLEQLGRRVTLDADQLAA